MKLKCIFCRSGKVCPIHSSEAFFQVKNIKIDNLDSTSPPTIFVGSRLSYPNVNIGILSPPKKTEDIWIYDAQRFWAEKNYSISQIVKLRASLINSRMRGTVHDLEDKNIRLMQEVGMSIKPVDVEIHLKKEFNFKIKFNEISLPMGPIADLKKFEVTENPKITKKVEKVYSDTDLKASEALTYLYSHNYDEQILSQLLSIGALGIKKFRRLVPTRNSITAVDDTIGKDLLSEIKQYEKIENYQLYFSGYLGNYYLILVFPEVFTYELFETYMPGPFTQNIQSLTDYEDFYGRKNYAYETAGGYYSARLPILEHLNKIKRQGAVLVLRFITNEYLLPLGVWVVRAATRKSVNSEPLTFETKADLIEYSKKIIFEKFKFKIETILEKSIILRNINTQNKLTKYFNF